MSTFSTIAIIVVAVCGGSVVYCIWRAGQILRREEEDFRQQQSDIETTPRNGDTS